MKQAIGKRQRAYETKRRINNEETVTEYIAARRQVKRIVKQEKLNKELSIAGICKHDLKSFYSYLNERRIVDNNKGSLKTLEEIVITTDNDMANIMNFSSVFTIEQLNNVPQLGQYEGNILDTFNFSTEEIQEKLQHLNIFKSTGPDMLHSRILCALEDKLARHLTHIFNNSVETGIMPEDWKSANVTAIHKKGSRQEPGNDRTISLTSVVCKTI